MQSKGGRSMFHHLHGPSQTQCKQRRCLSAAEMTGGGRRGALRGTWKLGLGLAKTARVDAISGLSESRPKISRPSIGCTFFIESRMWTNLTPVALFPPFVNGPHGPWRCELAECGIWRCRLNLLGWWSAVGGSRLLLRRAASRSAGRSASAPSSIIHGGQPPRAGRVIPEQLHRRRFGIGLAPDRRW